MTAPRPSFDADHPATRRQRAASDPLSSTWLSANAGSGKTRVLTDRVARLLLAGTDPAHVLCLTYTKAAAAEMQTRLFKRLGAWSMMEDSALIEDLRRLGLTEGLEPLDLPQARRLFAQALETPGGLRIQTIHAFCAGLLRRFPLEAGVSRQFREMDDRAQAQLCAEVAEELSMGPDAPLLERLARHLSDAGFRSMLAEIIARRDAFSGEADEARLRAHLGLPDDACEDSLLACVESAERKKLLRDLAAHCATGGKTDVEDSNLLQRLCRLPRLGLEHLALLEGKLLYKTGEKALTAKIDAFPSKALRLKDPALQDRLHDLMRDLESSRELRLCLQAHARNRDLHAFARAFVRAYEAKKLARGLLDFDDLIARARALLTDPAVAQWVLWRLDGGVDHILVDEAQDTSPAQWAVIERLAAEFTAGQGAQPRHRTIFVVGDRKQSIFSFQGADAEGFDRMQAEFGTRLSGIGQALQVHQLEYSFRSAEAVLGAVDATFRADWDGLGPEAPHHLAYKAGMPGRVDLWPPVVVEKREADDRPWTDPVDSTDPEDADQILATRVAEGVAVMVATGSLPVDVKGVWMRRAVTPGDVMILVQRRGPLFSAIIRELKSRGLDVAGADRLKLKAELAVRDVEATLRVLALPEDDLSLACALKSPLFGWDEAALYRLAQPRPPGQTLFQALERAEPSEALAILQDLRARADFLRPYELINRLLTRHDGRRRLLARLGPEAEDGLDAFLAQALAYEGQSVPSLTGFLEWRGQDEAEVKRQMDAAGDRIRVMTVHGAKGLEAPIVILPDCGDRKDPTQAALLPMPDGTHLWRGAKDEAPAPLRARMEALAEASRRERRRLLYVAMTRAESWLVVCGVGACGPQSWHGQVAAGLSALEAAEHEFPTGPGRCHGGPWDHLPVAPDERPVRPALVEPPVFAPVPPPGPRAPARAATDLGGATVLPAEAGPADPEATRARALARGALIHLALEHLPYAPPALVRPLLAATEDAALAGDLDEIVADAQALIAAPDLAPLWAPDALAEVSLTAEVGGLGRLHGTLDRLLVTDAAVTAVDFKTNRVVPATPEEVPEGVLRQMGAYLALLEALYPGREARVAVLWTRQARLMDLPRALVMAALRRADPQA